MYESVELKSSRVQIQRVNEDWPEGGHRCDGLHKVELDVEMQFWR